MNGHPSIGNRVELSKGSYTLTWTSERINRLLLHNREIHLWSDFHNFNQFLERLWPGESAMAITGQEARELIFEWTSNGPFTGFSKDWKRLPESVRKRLDRQLLLS